MKANKILIKTTIEVKSGLHIGGGDAFSAIGAVDSPVIKTIKGQPIIPGSSLKGKMRALLAKEFGNEEEIEKDDAKIKRLFGTANEKKGEKNYQSRLQFADCHIMNQEEFNPYGGATEVKFENTINRATCVANPRQIERVVIGAKFKFNLVYNVYSKTEVKEDFNTLAQGIKLLALDYLGGGGTRGNGRIVFNYESLEVLDDNIKSQEKELENIIKEACEYGISLYIGN